MNKKIVVLGGGTGMSTLLKGLKLFPVDITAIVSVCDDGQSTGRLRQEFNTPAVGDLRKVLTALSVTEPIFEKLVNYRFNTTSDLNGHTIGNLILTAMANITGNMSSGVSEISKIFNLKGTVLPLTEDNVILMAQMNDESIVEGEHNITTTNKKIKKVFYKETPVVCQNVIQAINEADLIILSMGSLYTSLIPNLICNEIIEAIDNSKSKIMYVCNMMTQPGETDNYKVSNHLEVINSYLKERKIDIVIANDGIIDKEVKEKYQTKEQKDQVYIDKLNKFDIELIHNDYVAIENEIIRHRVEKLALDIFAFLIK
ncbi:MAG: uridine diphosphate-N-acetylglucosamine-binding protein YvcK [Bacilli bacterium]